MVKSDVNVLPLCKCGDGYPCYRNLKCFSRFCVPYRCRRFVQAFQGAFLVRRVKRDLSYEDSLKRRERS